jgi:hypothetical protein
VQVEGTVIVALVATESFGYVSEKDEFLSLFPHRFDYIYADQHLDQPQASLKASPNWQTERRYPLSDRLIQQGHYLYGVRFGAQTNYCLLDIDRGSAYHPQQDQLAIARIAGVLEAIGLVDYVACTSSYSGGLHLYFPFTQAQSSWELAAVVSTLLENAGFVPRPGQLEVFPNPKPYVVDGKPSLFNAHRLPLQIGSYLLDRSFQPIWSSQTQLVQQWRSVENRNSIDRLVLKRTLKQARRRRFCISGKADKFINDLNAEIELGWTGAGQTNRLLGRIAMRTYIFHHIIAGGAPLSGQALVQKIVEVAEALPGYRDWCNHQSEIEQRAEEWARCIESSRYFHYGDAQGKYKTKAEAEAKTQAKADSTVAGAIALLPTWNQQQSAAARDRICRALADLLEKTALPIGATARFNVLRQYGIGGGSLYRHKDLWHPALESVENLLETSSELLPVENPPDPPSLLEDCPIDRASDASSGQSPTSLFPRSGGNLAAGQGLGDRDLPMIQKAGGNSFLSRLLDQERLSNLPENLFEDPLEWVDSDDLSDLLVAIAVSIRRLGWTKRQVSDRLFALFGKRSQAMLDLTELLQWLSRLNRIRVL